MLTRGLP